MKMFQLLAGLSFLFIAFTSPAQSSTQKSEKIEVWGNCGMCKSHIEKAAKEAGATYASWNKDIKVLTVKYDTRKTSGEQIQQKVAGAGYDTRNFVADEKAYSNLDDCCKYDRKAVANESKKDKQTAKACCTSGTKCDMTKCNMPSGKDCKAACAKNSDNTCCVS